MKIFVIIILALLLGGTIYLYFAPDTCVFDQLRSTICNLVGIFHGRAGTNSSQDAEVAYEKKDSMPYIGDSAEHGDASAQRKVGYAYYLGRGVTKDLKEAMKWFKKASEQGDAAAQWRLGTIYAGVNQDYREAVKWYRRAAEQEDAAAQISLGTAYAKGQGVDQDDQEAVKWFRKAAEQGAAFAQYQLGVAYNNGQGVKQDHQEAVKWFKKSAEAGNPSAQYDLGAAYYNGQGVKQDYQEAVHWFKKAADFNDSDAQYSLGVAYNNGQGVKQDYQEAVKWFRMSADQGNAGAQTYLGAMYFEGHGVEQNYREALNWTKKAAEQGVAFAQRNLGLAYLEGNGVEKNDIEAVKWFRMSAEAGNASAQYALGIAYDNGQGTKQDHQEAVTWYRKAAGNGISGAMVALGVCYAKGLGVIEDYIEAYAWSLLAIKYGDETGRKNKDIIQKRLSPADQTEAQRRAKIIDQCISSNQSIKETDSPPISQYSSTGTAFFICPSGYLLTSYHIIENANTVEVLILDKQLKAKVVFSDVANDAAILSVEGSGFVSLRVEPSNNVKAGAEVFTAGFPNIELQGSEAKYTNGVVSSISGVGNDFRLFQITVPVQPGNSGGPLLDKEGKVIGLVTARLSDSTTYNISGSLPQNVNYAIKSDYILPIIRALPDKICSETYETPDLTPIERARKAVALVRTY